MKINKVTPTCWHNDVRVQPRPVSVEHEVGVEMGVHDLGVASGQAGVMPGGGGALEGVVAT